MKEATASGTDHGKIVEVVWEEWKRRVTSVAERGIRLMNVVPGRAKSWWDNEMEAAIVERWWSCRSLRRESVGKRGKAWEEYKSKRCVVKKIIRQKKGEDRARTL